MNSLPRNDLELNCFSIRSVISCISFPCQAILSEMLSPFFESLSLAFFLFQYGTVVTLPKVGYYVSYSGGNWVGKLLLNNNITYLLHYYTSPLILFVSFLFLLCFLVLLTEGCPVFNSQARHLPQKGIQKKKFLLKVSFQYNSRKNCGS